MSPSQAATSEPHRAATGTWLVVALAVILLIFSPVAGVVGALLAAVYAHLSGAPAARNVATAPSSSPRLSSSSSPARAVACQAG